MDYSALMLTVVAICMGYAMAQAEWPRRERLFGGLLLSLIFCGALGSVLIIYEIASGLLGFIR